MLLGLLGKLLLGAAAVATVAAVVIVIHGVITKDKIIKELKSRAIQDALVKHIDNCSNTISLRELDGESEIEIQGDGISKNIHEGDVIYVS